MPQQREDEDMPTMNEQAPHKSPTKLPIESWKRILLHFQLATKQPKPPKESQRLSGPNEQTPIRKVNQFTLTELSQIHLSQEQMGILNNDFAELSDLEREIIDRRYGWEGLTYCEIASELNETQGRVQQICEKAIEALQKRLEE